jgi:glycosyltransferase involved in cell wall biosynthesis
VVGKPEAEDPVSAETISRLQSNTRVHLLGFMKSPEIAYATMSVLVLPSHREGFGLAALEAGAMQVPVVASAIPGLFDAVADGETGTLVAKANPAALFEAVDRYLVDEDLRMRHGQAGRRRAMRDFRQQDMWECILDNYLNSLAGVHR